jgi:phosphatidylglycerol---prolipoprotein diacylglyceryl transferase
MQQVLWRIPIKVGWFPDGIPIYGFGMMLFVSFLVCTWLAGRRAERVGIPTTFIQDLAIWIFVGGLLGARLTYLSNETTWPSLGELGFGKWLREVLGILGDMVLRLPRIWDGGIILYGSVVGALVGYLVGYLLVFRKYKLSTLKLADVIAPTIAVGMALGRIGCFLNGCCYGQVACADCAVYAVHFPVAAPAREALVDAGYQTVAGFTLAERQTRSGGALVGVVNPSSPAAAVGLRPGDLIVGVNDGVKEHEVRNSVDLASTLGSLRGWPRGEPLVTLSVYHEGDDPRAGDPVRLTFRPRTLGLYPTQPYEVVSMVLLFLLLLAYEPFRRHDGQVMAVLMMGYALHRYLNEILRDDPRPVWFERYSSVILFAAGALMWLWLQRRASRAAPAERAAAPAQVAAAAR